MSKHTKQNKLNNNINNNNNTNSISSKQSDNKQYNFIINQHSMINQDNSINIMLDTNFPYFQNYNYQVNETEVNNNQNYPSYIEQQSQIEQNNQNHLNINNTEANINNNEDKKDKLNTPPKTKKKKKHHYSPKDKQNKKEKEKEENNQNSTNKIDYRYVKKRPIKEMITPYKNESKIITKDNQLFWFATYDKLMKTKYLLKIFNYYNNRPFDSQRNINYNIKEKTLIVKDFEIYFYENSNKPFIRYTKGGTIYTKLYLLTLKQINQIFSYLNRIDYKIDYDRLNYLQRKGTFEIINDNCNEVILPYCLIYCLGKYMNINIYSFTNNTDFNIYLDENSFQKSQRISSYTVLNNNNDNRYNYFLSNDKKNNKMDNTNINRENYKLPNAKKIAKLVKIINLNFPDFSIDDIINYLIPDNKYMNSITKINEIKNIFFFSRSNRNKIILSSMVRDTIKGISIQTPKSLYSSFCPESLIENNSFKNSDLFQQASKKYVIPIKDDYKFQTMSTNEKDNNKNNPFIIYVCDNVQKINFLNDNQMNQTNQTNPVNNTQTHSYINPQIFNKSIEIKEINNNYEEKNNNILQTDVNQKGKNCSKINQNTNNNIKINNNIPKNKNKTEKKPEKKTEDNINKKKITRLKARSNKIGNDINDIIISGNKKRIKMKRITTDINTVKHKAKYNSLSGLKNINSNPRQTYNISQSNLPVNNTVNELNKSLEGNNNINYRLSKTSDIVGKKKQAAKNISSNNNTKTKLINRINMNKKENPFFNNNNNNNL